MDPKSVAQTTLSNMWIVPKLKAIVPTSEAYIWKRLGYEVYNSYNPAFTLKATPFNAP